VNQAPSDRPSEAPLRRATRAGGVTTIALAVALAWLGGVEPHLLRQGDVEHFVTGRVREVDGRRVLIDYSMAGRDYRRMTFWPDEPAGALAGSGPPPVGETLTLFVHPAWPGQASLLPPDRGSGLVVAGFGAFLVLAGLRPSFGRETDDSPLG